MDALLAELPRLLPVVALLILTGAAAGVLAGLLGVGGGIIIVPVLFWLSPLLGVAPDIAVHMAIATSLMTIIPTSIASVRAHHRKGGVDPALLKRWAPAMILGAAAGGLTARFLDGAALAAVFGVVALLVAANMFLPKSPVLSEGLPASRILNALIAAAIGLFSALMGIGGGTLSVPILSLFNFPIHRAVGTAAGFGVAIALAAVGFYVWAGWALEGLPPGSFGYVNLPAAVVISLTTIVTAPLGAKIAHAMPRPMLRRAFALFLAITGVRMLLK